MNINPAMISRLFIKDWQLIQRYMLLYIGLGAFSAFLMSVKNGMAYYTGVVMLVTVLIGACAHVVFVSIVIERKEHQMSFIMGLPINVTDYTLSKLLGGLVAYLLVWTPIVAILLLVIGFSDMPNGLMPMAMITALEILLATTLLLCVAIIFEQEAITIVVMVALNLLFNLFLFSVGQIPEINMHINSDSAVFNATVFAIIGAELVSIILLLVATTYYKSRQACFF